jgi:hypothetical protein
VATIDDNAPSTVPAAAVAAASRMRSMDARVEKAFLTDLETGESKSFLFNPAELEEVFEVNWNMFESPGMSHKRPQFVSSENLTWSFTAVFDQLVYERDKPRPPQSSAADVDTVDLQDGDGLAGTVRGPSEVEDWRNFVLSLATPRRPKTGGVNRFASASPAPVHFEWPGLVSTTVRIKRGKFKHTLFQVGTARPRVYSLDLTLFEDPAERIYADDVRSRGTIRPWATVSPSARGK